MKTQNKNFQRMAKVAAFVFLFAFSGNKMYSQADTIYTKGHQKIVCKIIEIGEFDLKYKAAQNLEGPAYIINITKVYKYTLANGYTEVLKLDELSIENQYVEIQDNKSVIKFQPFSFVNNQISFAYEHVIKMGTNLDVEIGYINNSFTESTASTKFYTSSGKAAPCTGVYLKPGVKFLLGQDFSLKGLKYAHALKGRYIKLDLAISYMNFQDVVRTNYSNYQYNYSNPNGGYTQTYTTTTSDINTFAYGGFVNYGRQFILGNVLTMDYYIGVGVTGQSHSYNNQSTTSGNTPGSGYYGYYNYSSSGEAKSINNYHAFFRNPSTGLSYTMGFRIGYILPVKNAQAKPRNQQEY